MFRLTADFLHLGGMVFGLAAVFGPGSVEGFSRKTQLLFQTVYVTRYLDVFTEPQGTYLLFFKVTFNAITALMLFAFGKLKDTYDTSVDSCNLLAIYLPTALVAYLSSAGTSLQRELWAYSEFLEPLALVPQYIMCYRVATVRPVVILYVLAVGGYRLLYVCNWIYKRYKWHGQYHDYISWFGGVLESVLFFDFVFRISQRKEVIGAIGASPLGRIMLHMDNSAGRFSEKIEMNSIGRRLPFGLSGNGLQDDERAKREWDVSDRLVEEEGCQLLTLSGDVDSQL